MPKLRNLFPKTPVPKKGVFSPFLAEYDLKPVHKHDPAVIERLWFKRETLGVLQDQAVDVLEHGAKVPEPEHGLD